MSWSTDLSNNLRLGITFILLLWNVFVSTNLETPYPSFLVDMYAIPITRLFLLATVLLTILWCPSAGIMAAFAYICLGSDVLTTTKTTGI